MISGHIQKSEYQTFLEHEFSTIYSDCSDASPIKPLLADIINRQEILYMQYDMQKKGKKFGITEWRLLKIENNCLYQVDKNQQEKQLPFPNSLTILRKIDDNEEWEGDYAQFQAKINMKFPERTDIAVYFRSIIQCNQIGMFLMSKIRQAAKRSFDGVASLFKIKMVDEMAKKIHLSKQQINNFKSAKIKAKVLEQFKKNLNDRTYIANFLEQWKSKALFLSKELTFSLKIKEMDVKLDSLIGILKIWAQGTVSKQILINNQNTTAEIYNTHKTIKFNEQFYEDFNGILSLQELQVQCQINGAIWKTERFIGNDLKRIALTHQSIELNLTNRGETSFIRISMSFQNSETFPEKEKITPKHYGVIDQLYNKSGERFELSKIHQHYQGLLMNQRKKAFYYTSFNKLKQLMELLKIDELIQKFYSVEPFNENIKSEFKGTTIYEYFLRNYEKQLYYEIQKLIWMYKEKKYKRILTALKVFDENPKFNFTDSFFFLVKRMYEIASRQTVNRWKEQIFSKNLKGIESIAFFLSIGIIKTFPNIFIYQQFVHKRALPYNSLLFIYVLKKQLPQILNRINKIQLNIESYFGCHFVNLFCKLLDGEVFNRVLLLLLCQKKQEGQSNYLYTLIGVFLTVINQIDTLRCAYTSAEHYMITFEQFCRNIENKFTFFAEVQNWRTVVKEYSIQPEFIELSNDMIEFYLNNAYNGELGEISKQIYQEFTCYHYKNETDLRKILIFIDKIDIGIEQQSHNITLSIFQSATRLYEHEFKGINLNQIDHFIEVKLIKLEQLTIICNTQKNSYSCRLDPKEVPSNLYFHFVKPLILTYHLSPEQNRHIFFQAYIKDNCEIQSLQNPIPTKYRQLLLEKDLNKQEMLFCKKFNKTFRMRENNFNLLYSKLGWFGNHYLIPDERLIDIEILGNRNGGKDDILTRIALINKYTRFLSGKALIPYPSNELRRLSIEIIKQNVHTIYEPISSSLKSSLINEASIYNSASRLLCYELDNFYIPTSMQFLEFYYQINEKLPLIRYLSYHPKLFFLLPTFTLQVSTYNSVCTIIISEKGIPFTTEFSPEEIQTMEQKSSEYNRMPQQIEFSYTDVDMYFDDFLVLLRLNILKRVIALDKKQKKQGKLKKWGNSLVGTSIVIPNYKLHHFYEVMNQTKQIIQLQFKQCKRLKLKISYDDYGLVGNRWISVYCIAKLSTSHLIYYYVLSQFQRKKYILKETDFIMVDVSEKKVINLSDDIANSMEVITYQLTQIFEI